MTQEEKEIYLSGFKQSKKFNNKEKSVKITVKKKHQVEEVKEKDQIEDPNS